MLIWPPTGTPNLLRADQHRVAVRQDLHHLLRPLPGGVEEGCHLLRRLGLPPLRAWVAGEPQVPQRRRRRAGQGGLPGVLYPVACRSFQPAR